MTEQVPEQDALMKRTEEFHDKPFEHDEKLRADYIRGIPFVGASLKLPIEVCFGLGLTAGWWHDLKTGTPVKKRNYGDQCSLFHSEISESYEAHRNDDKRDDKIPMYSGRIVELVDLVIRVFDEVGSTAETKQEFIEAFNAKLLYNANRADHKRENRAADGGKKL